jgi:hypothetical protein
LFSRKSISSLSIHLVLPFRLVKHGPISLGKIHGETLVRKLAATDQKHRANTMSVGRNGHGCMLQYAILHLFGYKLSLDDIKAFRVSDDISPVYEFSLI